MDILNEVEDLFKKLDAVPRDIKDAAVRKIVEKLSSTDGKKSRDILCKRRRPGKKRKSGEKFRDEQVQISQVYGPENHDSEYVVENILTSRGRKTKRLCYTQVKHQSVPDFRGKDPQDTESKPANITPIYDVFSTDNVKEYKLEEKLVIDDEKGDIHGIAVAPDLNIVKNESLIPAEHPTVELDGDVKLESSFEESQLVIVDPVDGQESEGVEETVLADTAVACSERAVDATKSNQQNEEKEKAANGDQIQDDTKEQKKNLKRVDEAPLKLPEVMTCDDCSFQTRSKALLRSHMRKHIGMRPHKCPDCRKTFPQLSALKIHMKRHRGQRDFPCDYGCNYRAYTKGDKVRHMTQHTGERSHQCQYCGKAFAKDSTLREHVKCVHEKPHKHICATCGFSTYRANNLRVHISMRHRGEYNNHVCPVCGAKVKQRTAFLDHMRSHTGERPYKCSQCTSSFTCLARLTVHRKAVHGPREFTCDHCQKTFQTKHHMLRHELTHTNQKPYACPFCSYSCNTQGNVTKHVKGVHNKPDFSYRKYKADQEVDADCKSVKSEWIEKGEKLTKEYLRDWSKKLGREVTLSELKEQEAEKNRRLTEEVEQVKKRRSRKHEHDYHSKITPDDTQMEEEVADEPTAVLLSVTQAPTSTSSGTANSPTPTLPQAHVLHGVTINSSSTAQPTLFIQTPRETDVGRLQSVLPEQVENSQESSLISGQNIQFCVNERSSFDDQIPLHVIYTPQSSGDNSQSNIGSAVSHSKYINNFNFVEVKGDSTSSQTVVVIINTDNH